MQNFSFDLKGPEDSPGFLLWQTSLHWLRLVKKALNTQSISYAQFVILAFTLWFQEQGHEPTQTTLAKWSNLDKMTISIAVKKLLQRDLIQQMGYELDTRAKTVSLTAAGAQLAHQLLPLIEKIDLGFFKQLPSQDRRTLQDLLLQLAGNSIATEPA